jgi:hypothetical protein
MRRKPFAATSALSLLLCVATVVLWIRSFIEAEAFGYSRYQRSEGRSTYIDDSVLSRSGELAYVHSVDRRFEGFRPRSRQQFGFERLHGTHGQSSVNESYYNHVIRRRWWLAGIGWGAVDEQSPLGSKYTARGVSVPSWVLLIVTLILPAVWLRSLVGRYRRRKLGLCPACAYSLTGNTSGVCPECGTAVAMADLELL